MKDILAKLKATVSERLESRAVNAGNAIEGDVRAGVVNFSTYRWVLVITALAAFYYAFIVSDRYVANAELYVKSTQNGATALPQLSLITGAGTQGHDASLLRTYILSYDMLRHLDNKLDLKAHYSSSDWDLISRMWSDPSAEDFLEYYRAHVDAHVDAETGVMIVSVQAFDPDFSLALLQEILHEGERFINSVGQQIALNEISFVEGELVRSKSKVDAIRDDMLAFQNEHQLFDPQVTGTALQRFINDIEGQIVQLGAEEKTLSSYLNDDAAEVAVVRDKIAALKSQLAQERAKMTGEDAATINKLYAQFREKELNLKFATDVYKASLQALEQARVESYHKLKHLVVIQSPTRPDEALMPRKLYNLATLFVVLSLAYGVIFMILATIREHRDV